MSVWNNGQSEGNGQTRFVFGYAAIVDIRVPPDGLIGTVNLTDVGFVILSGVLNDGLNLIEAFPRQMIDGNVKRVFPSHHGFFRGKSRL